jgi:ergothioneine biosynthesis protein EgtB
MALSYQRNTFHGIDGLSERFAAAWARTDEIFSILPEAELSSAPIVWRHPFIFYVGHLPAFSWNQVCGAILHWQSFNPHFDDLFCRGIDPDVDTGECHWHPAVPEKWPSPAETVEYRNNVRGAIVEAIDAVRCCGSSDFMAQNGRVFQLLLEHEYMHQETLMYMLQQVPPEKKRNPEGFTRYEFQRAAQSRTVYIPAGKARLGARLVDAPFAWDNEIDETVADVPAFSIDSLPVTNGQFLEFVAAGGYKNDRYWRAEDWAWKDLEQKSHPSVWVERDQVWFYRTMFDTFPLDEVSSWPVYVSLAEARAYARWAGKRLPTEAEFHRAAYYGPDGRQTRYPWGNGTPGAQHGNFDFNCWSPAPVGSRPSGASRWGVMELVGNGWELTDTVFAPFSGFSPYIASYPDYSRDFFDGKHFVLKGASWATPSDLLRPAFRNWYQAHYQYVFAKFRCVMDPPGRSV